jgi:CRISPR-associated protein (TIGR03986 family)
MPIDEAIIQRLFEFAQRSCRGLNRDQQKNAVLEEAFESYRIEDEAEEVWQRIEVKLDAAQLGQRAPQQAVARQGQPSRDRPNRADLFCAPYRFTDLDDRIAPRQQEIGFTTPLSDGYCAEIEVTWAAETPILIGEEGGQAIQPLTLNGSSDWVIPGATLRGMIRAAAEIAGFGRLTQLNWHHRYGVRDFQHPYYSAESKISDPAHVKAGWLQKVDGRYVVEPCSRWAHVEIAALLNAGWMTSIPEDPAAWSKLDLARKYQQLGIKNSRDGAPFYEFGTQTKQFGRVTKDAYGRDVAHPAVAGTPASASGKLVFSNETPAAGGKTYEYVFFDSTTPQPVTLSKMTMDQFERLHSRPAKNKLEPEGSWKELKPTVEAGGRIPVFYVGDLATDENQNEDFAMGLTRLFKLPHKYSVRDLLDANHPDHWPHVSIRQVDGRERLQIEPDFVDNLFGYVYEPGDVDMDRTQRVAPEAVARKGRVAFSFARIANSADAKVEQPRETIMMGPRASFSPFYLKGDIKDYSCPDSKLAGRKRYLPRYPRDRLAGAWGDIQAQLQQQFDNLRQAGAGKPSQDVITRLRFLKPAREDGEIHFKSRIRLHNVTAEELGLVLWALTHGGAPDKPYRHMAGRAKPFGAGQLRVASARLSVERNDGTGEKIAAPEESEQPGEGREGYCPAFGASDDPRQNASHRPFIAAFEAYMIAHIPNWRQSAQVREFLGACDPANGARLAESGKLQYLPLRRPKQQGQGWENPYQELRKMTNLSASAKAPAPGHKRFLPAPPDRRSET